jgi:DNA-binding MarR family transcriptional regulator
MTEPPVTEPPVTEPALAASPLAELDPVLTAPKRLAVMAVLAGSVSSDFGFLRDHLGVSDSDLSKQASALEAAGYVEVLKTGRGRGSVTTFRITKAGRRAFDRHRATLRALLARADEPDQ